MPLWPDDMTYTTDTTTDMTGEIARSAPRAPKTDDTSALDLWTVLAWIAVSSIVAAMYVLVRGKVKRVRTHR